MPLRFGFCYQTRCGTNLIFPGKKEILGFQISFDFRIIARRLWTHKSGTSPSHPSATSLPGLQCLVCPPKDAMPT